MDARGGEAIVFCCVPTGETSKLRYTVPNSRSSRQPRLNSVGHKQNRDMDVGKGPVGRVGVDSDEKEIKESGVRIRMHYIRLSDKQFN